MRKLLIVALIASLGAVASPADAAGAKFDGSVPLLCAPIEITQCDEGARISKPNSRGRFFFVSAPRV